MAEPTNLALAPRRTFAIISHPDAGKTTLTEKILLAGGAIHIAGEVKARGARRHARSDWMELEQQRGISITSSVMTFEHRGIVFNLLDTPGHQDFSEDTYRTLTAVDSTIMVLDGAKGIEAQTIKLFEICRLRNIPLMTFINKMDRDVQDPFALLDEIAHKLALEVVPINWPIGSGVDFKGCYDMYQKQLLVFGGDTISVKGVDDPIITQHCGEALHHKLIEDVTLLEAAGQKFDLQSYLEGHLTPVFFGSALKNFGVPALLAALYDHAPGPRPQQAKTREVNPDENKVTGFVFKIQANMDPNHRDRVAFVRLCSGTFQRGMKLIQSSNGKPMAVQNPVFFMARDRTLTEEARPGDIIGIPNHGKLAIGETLTEGENLIFKGIPSFAPEILRSVRPKDPMKIKNMRKGLEDLAEEGVIQLFTPIAGGDWIVGVVGQLQLDVLMSRMAAEYKVEANFGHAGYDTARWLVCDDQAKLQQFINENRYNIADDLKACPVFLIRDKWSLRSAEENWKTIQFKAVRESF